MPYIYKITNNLNGKIYIGKTIKSVQERFEEHYLASRKKRCEKRPLYDAINKYGIKNFSIEQIEECDVNVLSEREKYWIEYYGSFRNGYNATIGGDGKPYLDYDLIMSLWNEGNNAEKIAKMVGCCVDSVKKVLDINKVSHKERVQRAVAECSKKVAQIDKNTNEIIAVYPSVIAAARAMGKKHQYHFTQVCKGKRKTAYGYKWKYL